MTPLLQARDASYRVRGRALVDRVSLDLRSGELTIVVGPNGAGKSTLLRLLSGELPPSSGTVRCDGEALARFSSSQLASRRAVMSQASRLSFPFTVHEVVRLGVDGIGRRLAGSDREAIVSECLASAAVPDLADRLYQTLSGGEQRRVQFARALAQLAAGRGAGLGQALLLDEPIASLDLHHQLALMDNAKAAAARGIAVLAIIHDLNLAVRYADTLVVVDRGSIAACGPAARLVRDELVSKVFQVELAALAPDTTSVPFVVPRRWLA